MALAKQDYQEITAYLKEHISEWLPEDRQRDRSIIYELDVRERIVRVEEELKHQRELIQLGIETSNKRFEEMRQDMDKRFEHVDKRFEEMRQDMDKRFEHVDKRFEEMTKRLDVFMRWSITTTLAVAGILFAALKLWPPVAG